MTHKKTDVNRRTVLKGIAMMPLAAAVGYHGAAQATNLSVDDPAAKALGYVEASTTDGKTCSSCRFFSNAADGRGDCQLFPGKKVAAAGWCKSWTAA